MPLEQNQALRHAQHRLSRVLNDLFLYEPRQNGHVRAKAELPKAIEDVVDAKIAIALENFAYAQRPQLATIQDIEEPSKP